MAEQSWATGADLAKGRSALWRVEVHENDWRRTTCDCPVYQKSAVCTPSACPSASACPASSSPPPPRPSPSTSAGSAAAPP